ncbi:hypothetical protein AWH63_06660 [Marinobacter sp. C18]|uniref:hypothetical protein n=1 Tax=Marinobacter sp. C18 TaxID=1772288 RepID=UPI00095F266F|nr:hypothetical protein [Marinobacter sp. C18]OLF82681.1 hypothetical protein AWH63_06660 [Marinobacter sp. C18]
MADMRVSLKWPDKILSPNSRTHWRKRSEVVRAYRWAAKVRTRSAIQLYKWDLKRLREVVAAGGCLHVFIEFYPPDARRRDDDNLVASFKSGRDGLADALKIDDRHFRIHPRLMSGQIYPGGMVMVTIREEGPEA